MALESDRDREAAPFFTPLFRAAISANDVSEETQIVFPYLVGLLSGQIPAEEGSMHDRILIVHPIFRRVAVLRGDPGLFTEFLSASDGRKGPPPASKASIEALQTVEMIDAGEECSVCLEVFEEAMVKEMPCNHRFHGDCIHKWLVLHGTCPVCRYSMPAEEIEAKKTGNDGDVHSRDRPIWFEIMIRGGPGDQDQEQLVEEQSVDENIV